MSDANVSETHEERLKRDVAAAVEASWPQFAADHPELARTIDRLLLADHVADSLDDDPAFAAAYRTAVEANVAAEAMGAFVRRSVELLFARLK